MMEMVEREGTSFLTPLRRDFSSSRRGRPAFQSLHPHAEFPME
jgi:hypothetical protein